jgi:hypothetical protein
MRARSIVGFAALVGALALVAGAGGTTTPLPGRPATVSVPNDAAHAAVLTPGQSYNSLG